MALVKCGECGGQVSDKAAACPHCGAPVLRCPNCGAHVLDKVAPCPQCGALMNKSLLGKEMGASGVAVSPVLPSKRPPATDDAKKLRKDESVGAGCLVQGVGVLCMLWIFVDLVTGVLGVIIGLVLLAVGSAMSVKYRCSECSTKVEKSAKECPGCRRRFV